MRQERVVELFFGTRSRGSGYLITPQHVLTARHVVRGKRCQVQPLLGIEGPADERPAAVAGGVGWLPVDTALDLAVIRLDQALPLPGIDQATPLARIPRGEAWSLDFQGLGFPRGAGVFSRPVRGSLAEVPDAGRLDLELDVTPLRDVRDWSGLSGTVVFHGRAALGVVAQVDPKWSGGKLEATPVHRLLGAAGFGDWWLTQGQPALALTELGRQREAPVRWVTGRLHLMDREDSLQDMRALLAQPAGAAPTVVLVEGCEDDWHDKLIQRVAELPEMRRALGRDTSAENLILQLPWPQQARIEDGDAALRSLLQPLLSSTLGAAADRADLQALRQPVAAAMDELAPRAVWTLLRCREAYGGHADLAHALLAWWHGLPLRQRAFLFLCLATDAPPPPPPPSLFDAFRRHTPKPETGLVEQLARSLGALACEAAALRRLEVLDAGHVAPWIDALGGERERLLSREQWRFVADALRAELAAARGERLGQVAGRLRLLMHEALQQESP